MLDYPNQNNASSIYVNLGCKFFEKHVDKTLTNYILILFYHDFSADVS